ncbi:MAG: DUF1802 family protein [Thaumarchaeota archaeon]|nr:DUF1802 family protein [Nitrososphaerota archaeon]
MLTNLGLKEWAIVITALDRGEQVILLRKGGIAEKGFDIKGKIFLFYPTYFHEMNKHVVAKYQDLLQETSADVKEEAVTITNWAILDEVILTKDLDAVLKFSDHYVYEASYLKNRFDWLSEKPMNVLFTRVYRLGQPIVIPVMGYYRGCKSWVDLVEHIKLENSAPVLNDEEFEARKKEIKALLYTSKII